MSEVILEKGVCRIVLENTDKNDDYCLDVDAESDIEQSENSSCEDKIQLEYRNNGTYCYCNKEFNKREDWAVKKTESSSESEFEEYAKKRKKISNTKQCNEREQRPQFQNVPDLSYLLENDNNTIRKSFLHQHQNDNFENISAVQNDSQFETADAVRRLHDILVLPINQNEIKENYAAHQKESEVFERFENMFDPISMQETNSIQNTDFLKSPCSSSLVCFDLNNETNSLRTFQHIKQHNYVKELDNCNCQPDATFETNNTQLDESSKQVIENEDNNEVEYDYNGSDDTMGFNMAVEALNLLKNKGKLHSNSLDDNEQTSTNMSDELKEPKESPLPDSTVETYSNDDHFLDCSRAEKNNQILFDSTLEVRDCATGAIIPFELFFQSNCDAFLTTDENESSILNETQNETQTNKCIIPNTLTQLSDTVICVKVPLDKSSQVVCVCDHDSSLIKERDDSYSEQNQIEVNLTNVTVVADTSLKIAEKCSSLLPETTIPKEKEYKTKSLTKKKSQKTKKNAEDKPDTQHKTKYYSKSSKISGKKSKNYKNHLKVSSKLVTKITSLETKIKKYNDQIDEMNKNIEKRRSSQLLKISDCSLKESFELSSSITNISSMNEGCMVFENDSKSPNSKKNSAEEINSCLIPQAFLSSSVKLDEALNQSPGKQEDKHENVNLEKLQNISMSPKPQLSEVKEFTTGKHEDKHENGNPEKLQNISKSPKPQLSEEKDLTTEKIQQSFYLKKLKTPLDAFNLFINDSMIRRIVKYTNETILGAAKNVKNLGYKKATNEVELRAFIGLLLISAALRQNHVKVSELWSECFGASIYRVTLKEGRVYIFLQKLSFCEVTSSDKTGKKEVFQIGDPWEEYLDNLERYPMPKVSAKVRKYTRGKNSKQHCTSVRKTTNLSLSVLYSMLDTAVIRGTAIFLNENPRSGMCIRTFFKQVGMALVRPLLEEKLLRPTIGSTMKELIQCILSKKRRNYSNVLNPVLDQTSKKQKRCQLCSWTKDRKTWNQCICCQRYMCKEHRAKLCIQCIDSI